MTAADKHRVAIFVDRSCPRWIVRDPDGNYWVLPSVEDPWSHRQPFSPTAEMDLQPVPGHYKDMLRIPF